MYTKLLKEHALRSGTSQDFQSLVLGFVTHSQRPLRLIELTSAINTMPGRGGLTEAQDTKKSIRSCCGPLLEVCDDEVLQIIHHSFTEYLIGSEASHVQMTMDDTDRFPAFDSDSVHATISIACVDYLLSGVFDKDEAQKRCDSDSCNYYQDDKYRCYQRESFSRDGSCRSLDLQFSFASYAIKFWSIHAAKVCTASATGLYGKMANFLITESRNFECWMGRWSGLESHVPTKFLPLHVGAHCGITGYVERLLVGGADVDTVDAFSRTPLLYAAMNGHAETVDLLIQHGADITHTDNLGLSAVHMAAAHAKTLETLFRHGAQPLVGKSIDGPYRKGRHETRDPSRAKGTTILSDIVRNGHLESLRVLLAHVSDLDITPDALFVSGLGERNSSEPADIRQWAVKAEQTKIVEVLLTLSWDVNRKDSSGKTAIYNAAKRHDLPTLRVLVSAGANPNILSTVKSPSFSTGRQQPIPRVRSNPLYFNALHARASLETGIYYNNHSSNEKDIRESLDLLIVAGCDVNSKSSNGKTALFGWTNYSTTSGGLAEVFISCLLAHGADATIVDDNGNSILHGMNGYPIERKLAELLVTAGANINQQRTSDRKTPLMLAAQRQLSDPTLFRELGADMNLQDHNGNTALHMAMTSWCIEERHVDLWLKSADPTVKNNAGQMAVISFNWGNGGEGRVKGISRMVDCGMDLESRDHLGRTVLLQFLAKNETHDVDHFVKELLHLGADATAVDYEGRSALHLLARCELSYIDAGERDLEKLYGLMKAIVDKGCNINARDHRGQSIIQIALTRTEVQWPKTHLRAIAKIGTNIRGVDFDGRTILHSVATMPDNGSPRFDDGSASTRIDYILDMEPKFDVNARDHHGMTPLMLAAQVSAIGLLKLIQAGADARIRGECISMC
jgi:ankyrin repeat protein